MNWSLSVRFETVLGETERAEFSSRVSSHGARITSWVAHRDSGRTYLRIAGDAVAAGGIRDMFRDARIDEPALLVLEVAHADSDALARVREALAGPAGPVGVVDALAGTNSVVVEVDVSRTPLALIVHIIDAELSRGTPGRRIRPLGGLSDAEAARFAGDVLGLPLLAETHLIEHYSEPLLRGESV